MSWLWIVGTVVLCLCVCLLMYMYYKQQLRYMLAGLYKSTGTLCAMIPALVAAIKLDPHCYICVAALGLHAIADYILEFNFNLGAGLFLAGHICYIAFFTQIFPVSAVHMLCLAGMVGILVYALYRNRKAIGKRMTLFAIYGAVLCIMTGYALGCISSGTSRGIMIAAAGVLFFISDYILLHRTLYTAGKAVSWIIMITYYAAQLLFGFSCLYA